MDQAATGADCGADPEEGQSRGRFNLSYYESFIQERFLLYHFHTIENQQVFCLSEHALDSCYKLCCVGIAHVIDMVVAAAAHVGGHVTK